MRTIASFSEILNKLPIQKRAFASNKGTRNNSFLISKEKKFHVTSEQKYPAAAALPIPPNIDAAETTRFSPQRARDISATAILTHHTAGPIQKLDVTLDSTNSDPHVESYDCFGAVSLNSSMQSNVPSPLGGLHKYTHLNMPGGQWSQENKFMSHDLQSSHYMNLRKEIRKGWSNYDQDATNNTKGIMKLLIIDNNGKFNCKCWSTTNLHEQIRKFSTDKDENLKTKDSVDIKKPVQSVSRREQLKRAVKEYGSTVIIFHIGISLISLECFYLLVTSGIDLMPFIDALGLGSTALSAKIATGASSFVIAYAIHKIFAPVRISITLAATPFIVRYLRKKGILKAKTK